MLGGDADTTFEMAEDITNIDFRSCDVKWCND